MRIKHKVRVQIARDTAMKRLLFQDDVTLSEKIIDSWVRQNSGLMTVTASTSEDVPTGDIAAVKGCYIEADQEVILKLNGSTDQIQMRSDPGATTTCCKFFLEADITQINVTAGASAANIVFCLWGDAT